MAAQPTDDLPIWPDQRPNRAYEPFDHAVAGMSATTPDPKREPAGSIGRRRASSDTSSLLCAQSGHCVDRRPGFEADFLRHRRMAEWVGFPPFNRHAQRLAAPCGHQPMRPEAWAAQQRSLGEGVERGGRCVRRRSRPSALTFTHIPLACVNRTNPEQYRVSGGW